MKLLSWLMKIQDLISHIWYSILFNSCLHQLISACLCENPWHPNLKKWTLHFHVWCLRETTLLLFECGAFSCIHPRCSWADHVFICWSCHWHWMNQDLHSWQGDHLKSQVNPTPSFLLSAKSILAWCGLKQILQVHLYSRKIYIMLAND